MTDVRNVRRGYAVFRAMEWVHCFWESLLKMHNLSRHGGTCLQSQHLGRTGNGIKEFKIILGYEAKGQPRLQESLSQKRTPQIASNWFSKSWKIINRKPFKNIFISPTGRWELVLGVGWGSTRVGELVSPDPYQLRRTRKQPLLLVWAAH